MYVFESTLQVSIATPSSESVAREIHDRLFDAWEQIVHDENMVSDGTIIYLNFSPVKED
jgi:hypothetical protein